MLWPSAIALAHELAARDLTGKRVLELGAGTGLPGIIAAGRGAHVVQTDRQSLALHLGKRNAERNGIAFAEQGSALRGSSAEGRCGSMEQRTADWTAWSDDTRYDLVIGADILYARELHPHLRKIFAQADEVMLGDPYRANGLELLEAMEKDGWRATLTKYTLDERAVGVFQLRPAQ